MMVSLDLHVFNWLLGVEIKGDRAREYERAARRAHERYNLYYKYFKDRKTEYQIALMTMLDLCVQPFVDYCSNSKEKESIIIFVCDEKLSVTVNKDERLLYENAAIFVTERYSWYLKTYGKVKCEMDISKMALVDICIEKFI